MRLFANFETGLAKIGATDHTANGKYEVSTIGDGMTGNGVGSCQPVKRLISAMLHSTLPIGSGHRLESFVRSHPLLCL